MGRNTWGHRSEMIPWNSSFLCKVWCCFIFSRLELWVWLGMEVSGIGKPAQRTPTTLNVDQAHFPGFLIDVTVGKGWMVVSFLLASHGRAARICWLSLRIRVVWMFFLLFYYWGNSDRRQTPHPLWLPCFNWSHGAGHSRTAVND